jgi:hypothetical protein
MDIRNNKQFLEEVIAFDTTLTAYNTKRPTILILLSKYSLPR